MGNNVKKRFTVSLDIDTKDLEKQVKGTVGNIKTILSDIGKASDKMTYFKELVDYLGQIDSELAAFKQKHGDGFFNQMFGGLDENLRKEMEEVFGTAREQMSQLEQIRDRINTAKGGKATKDDLQSIERDVRGVYEAAGMLDKLDLPGTGKIENRIKKIEEALSNFALAWQDVNNRVAQGLNFGGGGTGGNGFGGAHGAISKEMQEQIDRLQEQKRTLQEVIDAINKQPIKIATTAENDAAELQGLIDAFRQFNKEINDPKTRSLSVEEYNKKLAEGVRLASLLVNTAEEISFNPEASDDAAGLAVSSTVDAAQSFLDTFYENSKDKINNIRKSYIDLIVGIETQLNQLSIDAFNIEPTKESLSHAISLMTEANRIMSTDGLRFDSSNIDLLDNQLDILIDKIKVLATSEEQIQQIDDLLADNRDAPEDIFDELCTILSVDIPRSAQAAHDALGGIAGSSGGKSDKSALSTLEQFKSLVSEIEGGVESAASAHQYQGQLDVIYQQIQALHELGQVNEDVMSGIDAEYNRVIEGCIKPVQAADNLLTSLSQLNDKSFVTDDVEKLEDIIVMRNQLIDNARTEGLLGDDILNTQQAITAELKNRLALLSQQIEPDTDEDLDDIQKENGALEQKLEILKGIADAYGVQITQKDRNRYEELVDKDNDVGLSSREEDRMSELSDKIDEADSNLLEFEETYDRIVIKLSNGKKIEILPNDKGLRDLYEIADSYGTEYKGFDIEDVEFVRKAAQQAETAIDDVAASVKLIDGKDGQLALFDNVSTGANKATEAVEELNNELHKSYTIDGQMGIDDYLSSRGIAGGNGETSSVEVSTETAELGLLQEKLIEVTNAVDAKTNAFKGEHVAVDAAVAAEIESLNNLKLLLDDIQNYLQTIFGNNTYNFGNLDLSQDKMNDNAADTALQNIQQTLGQILTVLQGFTGIKSDKENSLTYQQPVVNNSAIASDAYELIASKLSDDIATETTLASIKGILETVSGVLKNDNVSDETIDTGVTQSLKILIDALSANILVLKDATNGVIEQQKDQKTDTSAAMAKIADPDKHRQISDIAANSVSDLGVETQINGLKALANGVVKVEGAYKNADGAWEGFTVKVNKSNKAVDLAIDKQSAFANALNETKAVQDSAAKQLAKQIKSTAGEESTKLKGKFNTLDFNLDTKDLSDERQAIVDEYKELSETLKQYKQDAASVSQDELDDTLQRVAALHQEIDAYKQKYNILNAHGKESGNTYGATQVANITAKYNALRSDASDVGLTAQSSAVLDLEAAYNRLVKAQEAFVVGEDKQSETGKAKIAEFNAAKVAYNELYKALEKMVRASKALEEESIVEGAYSENASDPLKQRLEQRKAALTDFVTATYGANAEIGKFGDGCETLSFTIKNGDGTITKMTASLNAAKTAIYATAGATQEANSGIKAFAKSVLSKFKSIVPYLTASFGWQEIIQQLRKGVQYVREIDSALTELKKVTDESEESYNRFLQTASKTAGVIGSTVAEFTNATADFARLGYNLSAATELAKAASVYKNVGDGITDISQASESIISTMKAFGIEANGAMGIVDRFNEVGNSFAISSTGIGEAMQRSASALYESGNTIDESIALITAANSVVYIVPRRYSNIATS